MNDAAAPDDAPLPDAEMPVPALSDPKTLAQVLALREAIGARQLVRIGYRAQLADAESPPPAAQGSDPAVAEAGDGGEWTLRPLGCFEWSDRWALAAWSVAPEGFHTLQVERIESLTLLDERFDDEPGRTLADHQRALGMEMSERDSATDA